MGTKVRTKSRRKTFRSENGYVEVEQTCHVLTDCTKPDWAQKEEVVPILYRAEGELTCGDCLCENQEFDLSRYFPGCSGTSFVRDVKIDQKFDENGIAYYESSARFECTGPVTINGQPAEELFA